MSRDNFDFTLVRPHEVRQRFTEYVIMNQDRALQNMSLMSKDDSLFMRQTKQNVRLMSQVTFKKSRSSINESSILDPKTMLLEERKEP